MPDSAVEFEHPKNMTVFWPYFTTNIVEVHREVEAFSFDSLVADVGGVLGLFIGFNFLMIWDWILQALTFFKLKLTHLEFGSNGRF